MIKKKVETKKENKRAPATELEEVSDDLGKKIALHALYQSEGGQLLVQGLIEDIISAVELFSQGADTLSHPEMILLAAKIRERLDLVSVLTSSKANMEVYQDLLAEAIGKEKENESKG